MTTCNNEQCASFTTRIVMGRVTYEKLFGRQRRSGSPHPCFELHLSTHPEAHRREEVGERVGHRQDGHEP